MQKAIRSGYPGTSVPVTLDVNDITPVSCAAGGPCSVTDAQGNVWSMQEMTASNTFYQLAWPAGEVYLNGSPFPGQSSAVNGDFTAAIRVVNGVLWAEGAKGHGWSELQGDSIVAQQTNDPGAPTTMPTGGTSGSSGGSCTSSSGGSASSGSSSGSTTSSGSGSSSGGSSSGGTCTATGSTPSAAGSEFNDPFATLQIPNVWNYINEFTPNGRGGTADNESGTMLWINPTNPNTDVANIYSIAPGGGLRLGLLPVPNATMQNYINNTFGESQSAPGENLTYVGGLLSSSPGAVFYQGYYQVVMSSPQIPGWTTQVSLETPSGNPWPPEIDFTLWTTSDGVPHVGLRVASQSNGDQGFQFPIPAGFSITQLHAYAVWWTGSSLTFYIDGNQVWQIAPDPSSGEYTSGAAVMFYLLTASAYGQPSVAPDFGDNPNPASLPGQYALFDSVTVWSTQPTGSGNTGSSGSSCTSSSGGSTSSGSSSGSGSSGGTTVTDGLCGSANGATFSSMPTTNLCTTGTASAVTADGTSSWIWTCTASTGGTVAGCFALEGAGSSSGGSSSGGTCTATNEPAAYLFAPTSVFNLPIGSGATWQPNAQLAAAQIGINTETGTCYDEAIYTSSASDPVVTVSDDGSATDRHPALTSRIFPPALSRHGGGDETLSVDDTSTGTWYSFGGFVWTGSNTATSRQADFRI